MSNRNRTHTCVYALLLTAALATANPLPAFAQESHRFEIATSDSTQAIQDFGAQSGTQILASAEELKGKRLHQVNGTLSTDEGLKVLLAGTGLTHRYVGERTVALVKEDEDTSEARPKRFWDRFRVAQTDRAEPSASAAERSASDSASSQSGEPQRESKAGAGSRSDDTYASPFALEEIVVSSERYGATVTTAGRLAQLYIDIPQSVSVVTSKLLKDANIFDSYDALKYVPNVQQWQAPHNPQVLIRGIESTSLYQDGFLLNPAGGSIIDTAFTDRIEVIKGPSSAGFGRGNPAGFVNYVSKSPLFVHSTEIGVTSGTGGPRNNLRFTLDNNGFVTEDGKTAYRLVASYNSGSTTIDDSEFERSGALLSVERELGERGDLKIVTNLFRNHNASILPFAWWSDETSHRVGLQIFGSTTTGIPLFDPDRSFAVDGTGFLNDGFSTTATLNYRLSEHWSTRQAMSYNEVSREGITSFAVLASVRDVNGVLVVVPDIIQSTATSKQLSYQSDFVWQRESSFLDSNYTLLFGGDISDFELYSAGQRPTPAPAAQPILDWNPHVAYSFANDIDKIGLRTTGSQWSPYAQLGAGFLGGKVQPTVAARKVYYDQEAKSLLSGAVTRTDNSTPVFGTYSLLFKPRPWLSIYALKSKYQEPATVRPKYSGVATTDPRFTETITAQPTTDLEEAGVKGSLLNDKLTFSVSAFNIKAEGALILISTLETAPDGTINTVRTLETQHDTSSGWELEVFGQPTDRLTLMLGGGVLNTSRETPVGPNVVKLPRPVGDTLFGNVKYSFGPSENQGLTVRAGAKYYFSGWNVNFNPTVNFSEEVPYPDSKLIADFGLTYRFGDGQYGLGLSVNNAFHEDATGPVTNDQYKASGRQVFLDFDAKF